MKNKLRVLSILLILISVTLCTSCTLSNLFVSKDNVYSGNDESTQETTLSHISSSAISVAETLTGISPFEIAKSAHDWIIINTIYDTTSPTSSIPSDSFSPKGVFINGTAVCQGYALAFEELMDARDIQCKVVYGHAGGVSHAWNIVEIDGEWYHVDTTWDDPIINGTNGNGTENLSYDYFLVPEEVILQSHSISYLIDNQGNEETTIPSSTSQRFLFIPKSFGIDTSEILETLNDIPEKYYELLHRGLTSVTFFYPDSESFSMSAITELQHYVASRDGSCSGFSVNEGSLSVSGYNYVTLIPR